MDLGQQTEIEIFNQKKNTRFPANFEFMVKKKRIIKKYKCFRYCMGHWKNYSLVYLILEFNWESCILSGSSTTDPHSMLSNEVDWSSSFMDVFMRNSWKPWRKYFFFMDFSSQLSSKISAQPSAPTLLWGPGRPHVLWRASQWFLNLGSVVHSQSLSVLW